MKIYSNRKQDGFGSVYLCCMCCFARARHDGAIYRHAHFSDLPGNMHHNPGMKNKDFSNIMNDFTGLVSDSNDKNETIEINFGHGSGVQGGFPITREHMNSIMNPSVVDELRNMYYSNTKPTPISCDVAVHIRRGDIAQKSQNGVYRSERCSPLDVYIKKIEELQSDLNKRLKIIIFSEGKTEDFEELFTIQNVDIELHLNEDLCITFHSMVKAPILILSMSMLSIAAGILNENEVHYMNWNAFAPLSRWNVY